MSNWRYRQFWGNSGDPLYKSGCGLFFLIPLTILVILTVIGVALVTIKKFL